MLRTTHVFAGLVWCALAHACGATAAAGTKAAPAPGAADVPRVKACPRGFIAFGTIEKIAISKRGMVTEFVRMKDGSEQRMPAFMPVKAYENQAGDAFCVDVKPESN